MPCHPNRRSLLRLLPALAGVLLGAWLLTHSAAADVLLFADDQQLASRKSLRRVVLPAAKLPEPVIEGDVPWSQNPYAYGSFLHDPEAQKYRAWYQSLNSGPGVRTPLLYNESRDGRRWQRPSLGLVESAGGRDTNILLDLAHLYSPSVVRLPNDRGGRYPYRLVFWDIRDGSTYDGGGGMYTAVSEDGIHWKPDSQRPRLVAKKQINSVSDVLDLMYDPRIEAFVVHAKCWRWDGEQAKYRMICRSQSRDFRRWSTPEVVFDPRAEQPDAPQTYGMPTFVYQGQYFGLLRIYHSPGNETIEIELAHSRDDHTWQRVAPGEPLIPVGSQGTWDDGMVFAAPPVIRSEQMEFFYGGWDGPHNVGGRRANIGLATTPLGRLVALVPEGARGTLRTEVLEVGEGGISLNVDARQGAVRVAVLDEAGEVLPGRGLDDCQPIEGDHLRHQPRWRSAATLPPLPGRIRLEVELTGGARLYEIAL